MCVCVPPPSWTSTPPHPHPTQLGHQRTRSEPSTRHSRLPLVYLFYTWQCTRVSHLPVHHPPSPAPCPHVRSIHLYLYWWAENKFEGKLQAQDSLELKLPSGSSLPFYAKQRTLSPEEKKWTLSLITPKNYSKQPWRRTGPLKTVDFHLYAYINLLFSWVSAAAH